MTTHTPGPWTADKLQDQSAFNIFMQGYGSAGASVHHCSNATNCMGSLEVEANARLIAAAPDLLAALLAVIEEAGPQFGNDDGPGTINHIAYLARQAVAKVRF